MSGQPQTIAEKILSLHSSKKVYADEIAIVTVDGAMASDTTAPYAIKAFEEMAGNRTVWNPDKIALVIDHAAPAPNQTISNLHQLMRQFGKKHGIRVFDVGEGICHQVIMEHGYVKPGDVFIGADSHTTHYGCINAFATGVGATDLAAVWLTGKIWLKVPRTIKVVINGSLQKGVYAKDVIMHLMSHIGIEGATYQAIEYCGSTVAAMSLSSRAVLANMAVEMGAKAGLVHPEGLQLDYSFTPIAPDEGAVYSRVIELDVSQLKPQVSLPHQPDQVTDLEKVKGKKITYAFIGTCTNGRLEDLHAAANVLRGRKIHPSVRMLVIPASKQVFQAALRDGTVEILLEAGVSFATPGCGPCVGSHMGVPADGEVVISAANRNFKGRMGNPNAEIYLASPATVAASAVAGCITEAADL
ncbi:MAG: 3-isopropylmalate dehydratase large subunit [Cytophagales bacterium]|nr:3-isopropylmalate dehydratase large subunit [Bernardetiaceae bacterium]MDW8210656.1 3-isopropylmalate dehydratase large subunit [Cytophagales bacterium]